MAFIKFAYSSVLGAEIANGNSPLMKTAHRHTFDYAPREGFLYVRSRAISSRTNDNFDTFPAEEIKKAWATFVGKPVFVNHNNEDHRRARGVIIDAALHEDTAPDGTDDTWVEVLMEIDALNFPKLAKSILAGDIERTSMGCDVQYSICSVCGNKASTPIQYCQHIPRLKGKKIRRRAASGDGSEDVLVHEVCCGLSFFENSVLVEPPADPTAHFLGVDARGVTAMTKAASRSLNSRKNVAQFRRFALEMNFGFDSQAVQFPEKGEPGVSYSKETAGGGTQVDCLLWRDDNGTLRGILYHYPQGTPWEDPGSVNLIVDDSYRKRGIATTLMDEAVKRFKVNLKKQTYTDDGYKFITKYKGGKFAPQPPFKVGDLVVDFRHEYQGKIERIWYEGSRGMRGPGFYVTVEGMIGQFISEAWELAKPEKKKKPGNKKKAAKEYPSLTGLYPGDRFIHERYGECVVTDVRRARNNKGIQGYDSVKVIYGNNKTVIIPMFSRPQGVRKQGSAGTMEKARLLLSSVPEYLHGRVEALLSFIVIGPNYNRGVDEELMTAIRMGDRDEGYAREWFLRKAEAKAHYARTKEWIKPIHPRDEDGPKDQISLFSNKRLATSDRVAYGEVKAPAKIDTLRVKDCPVCGEDETFDSDNRCRVCGYLPPPEPFREPDLSVAQKADMRSGPVNEMLLKSPVFEAPDDDFDEDQEDNSLPSKSSHRRGRISGRSNPVKNQANPSKYQRPVEGDKMRPSVAAAARQRQIMKIQADRIKQLERSNRILRRRADVNNPGQPVAEPGQQAPAQTTEDARAAQYNTSVTTPGGIASAAPAMNANVMVPGGVSSVSPAIRQDVTAPVSGYNQSIQDMRTEVEVVTDGESIGEAYISGDWANTTAKMQARTFASLRLARLRIEAGLVTGDDIIIAQKIAGSRVSDAEIRTEIETLTNVRRVDASRRPSATTRHQAVRNVPSLVSTAAPVLAVAPPSMNPSSDEFLFD